MPNSVSDTHDVLTGSANEPGELESSIWAVISFDRVEAAGINYDTAVAVLNELRAKGVSGLCIVTADAARRVS